MSIWLILLIVLFVLAIAGGGWGHTRYGYTSWSPLLIILAIAVVLYLTGHLTLHG